MDKLRRVEEGASTLLSDLAYFFKLVHPTTYSVQEPDADFINDFLL